MSSTTAGRAAALPLLALALQGCARTGAPPVGSAPPSNLGCGGAVVCEDFENAATGQAPGGPFTLKASPGETVVVDGQRAASGGRALRFRHSGTAHHYVYVELGRPTLPLPNNDLHGRLMLFTEKVPPRLHWDNVRGSGPLPDGKQAQYNVGGQKANLLSNYEPHDCWRGSQRAFPTGRWVCLQWRFSGPENTMRVWLDGQPVEDATVQRFGDGCVDKTTSEWVAPRFETLSIGWEQYRASDPMELWVDDIAVGPAPIPCPTAAVTQTALK